MLVSLDQVKRFSPRFHLHENEQFFPCTIEYLLANATLYAADGSVLATNPSQDDLTVGSTDGGSGRYVDINESQYPGLPPVDGKVTTPIYYAVQSFSDAIVIHYLALFAYQGGQTCEALRAGTEFNCIVNTFGSHQGDLERVAVILSNDGNFTPLAVEYESHGDRHVYAPALVPVQADDTGWHPLVNVALNGHSLHNLHRESNPVVEDEVPAIVAIISAMSDLGQGIPWDPVAFEDPRLLGLDEGGKPIGEHWSSFAGRLGKHQDNSLQSATYFDGSGLNGWDWAFVSAVGFLGALLDKFPEDIKSGDGPEGPGARDWVRPAPPDTPYLGDAIAELNNSDLGQGGGAVAYLMGRFFDIEQDSILQFWDNDGTAAVITYALNADGVLACQSMNNNLNNGPGAIGWLTGAYFGGEVEQVLQLWSNGGSLGMILYGIGETENVCALWGNPDMGQGSGAVQWLTGDFAGNGKTQVLQCWGNGGSLGMILYGDDGSGGLKGLWSNPDMGQGPGAVQWLTGDFAGNGKTQVLQCWGNGGSLGMILYGDDGQGGLAGLWSNPDMGQSPGAVQWLTGDFAGDGKTQVLQCWGNGGSLGMILYGDDGKGGLKELWSNSDMGEGPGAYAWFAGNFTGGTRDRIMQLWGSDLHAIQYGTLQLDKSE